MRSYENVLGYLDRIEFKEKREREGFLQVCAFKTLVCQNPKQGTQH